LFSSNAAGRKNELVGWGVSVIRAKETILAAVGWGGFFPRGQWSRIGASSLPPPLPKLWVEYLIPPVQRENRPAILTLVFAPEKVPCPDPYLGWLNL